MAKFYFLLHVNNLIGILANCLRYTIKFKLFFISHSSPQLSKHSLDIVIFFDLKLKDVMYSSNIQGL